MGLIICSFQPKKIYIVIYIYIYVCVYVLNSVIKNTKRNDMLAFILNALEKRNFLANALEDIM